MSKHVADRRELVGYLSCVDAEDRGFLLDVEGDIGALLRRIRREGVHRKRVLECLGPIRMCARANDLVFEYKMNEAAALDQAAEEAIAIAAFFEYDIKKHFFMVPSGLEEEAAPKVIKSISEKRGRNSLIWLRPCPHRTLSDMKNQPR